MPRSASLRSPALTWHLTSSRTRGRTYVGVGVSLRVTLAYVAPQCQAPVSQVLRHSGPTPRSGLRFRGRHSPDPPWLTVPARQIACSSSSLDSGFASASSPEGATPPDGDGRLSGLVCFVSGYPVPNSVRFAHYAWDWRHSPGADLRQVTCLRLLPGQSCRSFARRPTSTQAGCHPARSGARPLTLQVRAGILRCSTGGRLSALALVPDPRDAPGLLHFRCTVLR